MLARRVAKLFMTTTGIEPPQLEARRAQSPSLSERKVSGLPLDDRDRALGPAAEARRHASVEHQARHAACVNSAFPQLSQAGFVASGTPEGVAARFESIERDWRSRKAGALTAEGPVAQARTQPLEAGGIEGEIGHGCAQLHLHWVAPAPDT